MITITRCAATFSKLSIAVILANALQAHATSFSVGDVEVALDSQLSVGASWGLRNADPDLVGSANTIPATGKQGRMLSTTGDDGRLNFKKYEAFSKVLKGSHDLELRYGNTGAFMRGTYWKDWAVRDGKGRFKPIENSGRAVGSRDSGAQLLDAFVYHNYSIGEMPGSVRLGKQVVSWGESTFIFNSINSINPVDVAAFRRPGAEIKEGLIPVNMFYISQNLTDSLAFEAFYQLQWDSFTLDNCGTFFAGDVAAKGCNTNFTTIAAAPAISGLTSQVAAGYGFGFQSTDEGVVLDRTRDRKARDDGQFGVALRYQGFNTEYGFYAMNYHSRTPVYTTQNLSLDALGQISNVVGDTCALLGTLCADVPAIAQQVIPISYILGNSNYYFDYPEDIRLFGASFATVLPTGTAWAGELSYRPNAPLVRNGSEMTGLLFFTGPGNPGAINRGYNRKEITQLQSTLTHVFNRVLGAANMVAVGEAGVTRIGGLESRSEVQYGRDGIYGRSDERYGLSGFTTRTSWGYRGLVALNYTDAFAGINLTPSLSFSHDVKGYGPNGLFNEGAKSVSLALRADFLNKYSANVAYTEFFGGRFNTLKDRDFVSISASVNF